MRKQKEVKISASVSCMDLCNLETAMKEVEESPVSFYHFDVVDGRFNQCFILGETTLEQMSKKASLPIEVHLATYHPEKYIKRFIEAGAKYVAVHYEAMKHPLDIFWQIRECGGIPILAYRAETGPVKDFAILAKEVPWILKLMVHPGFAGQKMQPSAIEHIKEMKKIINENNLDTLIQADGNINESTVEKVVEAGADILTGGTSGLFLKDKTVKECCQKLMELGWNSYHNLPI